MKKEKLTLKDTFAIALKNYKEKKFLIAENLCNKILSIDPDHFDSLVLLSNMYAIKKDFKKAKELMIKADKIKPNNLSVLNNLGTACKELGDNKSAVSYYEKIIKINPNHTNAQYNLGVMFYNLKEYKKAKNFFQKTTEIQPNYALAFISLANVFFELKEYTKAIKNYQKAIEINPNIVGAHNNLGLVFRVLNDYENAIKCYEQAIKINKNNAGAYHNLALAQKEIGKFTEAVISHEQAIKLEPNNLTHYFYLSELKKDIVNDNLKDKIKNIIEDKNSTKQNIAYGNYLLAKYERKNKNYKKELNYLEKGHQSYFDSKKNKFDLGVKYCFEDVLQISMGAKVQKLSTKSESNIKPIFIIGVPRCGSTLVEKIITSGSKFIPIGEETAVLENFINKKILEKSSLNLGKATDLRKELSEIYKQKGLIYEKYDNIFTDKSLNNFFYLEIIKDVFPNAKIINCNRDLLSSIMSIYQNNITELAWVHNLDNIFKYIDNYLDIIENFEKNNPNIIYEIQLEKLIKNPEEESKKVMEYCELPWDKKCLEFYKRRDLISKTASNVQIRGAINKDNLKKYLPYKDYLSKYKKIYPWFK
tara:strand:+ start:1443 stop:3209 length:1767 start_codon:yes stop_codon:yes gene_type:complete